MENRFGFRELVFVALFVAVIITLVLGMKQTDRQWDEVRKIHQQLTEQTADLARMTREGRAATAESTDALRGELERIREALERGVPVAPPSAGGPESAPTTRPALGPLPGAGVGATPAGTAPATTLAATAPSKMGPWVGEGTDAFARVKAAETKPGYARGDWQVTAFSAVPGKLTPLVSTDSYAAELQGNVLESLANRDPVTQDWKPVVAKSWRISEDGLTIEFTMRPEAAFSDGQPLTADDVLYTYRWIMNEQVECPRERAYFGKIARVEKLGRYRVAFVFKEPYFQSFELAASMGILPEHFYRKYSATEFNRSVALLLGSGPYRMEDPAGWTPDKPVVLLRNERYWGPPAPFDRLVYQVISNESARLTTFRNGDLDVFAATPEQYTEMLRDQPLLDRTQHFEYFSAAAGYRFVGWNQRRGGKPTLFADKRVRRALALLADRPRIVEEILLGYAKVADGPFNPLSKQHAGDVEPLPFDPQKGAALLAEAGFRDTDGDGVLNAPAGEPFRFKLMYPSQSDTYTKFVLLLKDNYAKAGIALEPDPTEWNVLLKRLDTRDFDACSMGWTAGIETDPFQIFHSSQIEGTADNFISYRNPELDKLIDEARATVDDAKRMPLWQQAHRLLAEDQPYMFLTVGKSLLFVDDRIHNVEKVTLGLNPDVEWFVPAEVQKYGAAAGGAPRSTPAPRSGPPPAPR